MFGNVIPAEKALSLEDRELFRGYYCALCREIGKRSQSARIGLSYDITFLALILEAISNEEPRFNKVIRCPLHPFKKTSIVSDSDAVRYAADLSVVLIKAKLDDDCRDKKNPIYRLANAIICDRTDCADEVRECIRQGLLSLDNIEKENRLVPDEAADCFAALCGGIFAAGTEDTTAKKPLYWLGYNIGRWTYLLDAYADIEEDIKNGSYNPFKTSSDARKIIEEKGDAIEEMLYFTLSQVSAAFDILKVKRYKSLLENIIYIGLVSRQEAVITQKRKEKGNEPI